MENKINAVILGLCTVCVGEVTMKTQSHSQLIFTQCQQVHEDSVYYSVCVLTNLCWLVNGSRYM